MEVCLCASFLRTRRIVTTVVPFDLRYWSQYKAKHCLLFVIVCDRRLGRIRALSPGWPAVNITERAVFSEVPLFVRRNV